MSSAWSMRATTLISCWQWGHRSGSASQTFLMSSRHFFALTAAQDACADAGREGPPVLFFATRRNQIAVIVVRGYGLFSVAHQCFAQAGLDSLGALARTAGFQRCFSFGDKGLGFRETFFTRLDLEFFYSRHTRQNRPERPVVQECARC
jgi:hypothetical protein